MDFYHYIKFPFNDPKWFNKLGIGSIVLLAPIINILAFGYFVECIKVGAYGRRTLPYWQDFEGFLRQGLIALLIFIAYFTPTLLLIPLFLAVPIIGIFMLSTIFLIVGLLVPIAIANYVIYDEIKNAFKIGEIISQLSQILNEYIIIYLIIIIIFSISIALIFALPLLAIFAAVANFYCGVIFANFIGQILRNTCHR